MAPPLLRSAKSRPPPRLAPSKASSTCPPPLPASPSRAPPFSQLLCTIPRRTQSRSPLPRPRHSQTSCDSTVRFCRRPSSTFLHSLHSLHILLSAHPAFLAFDIGRCRAPCPFLSKDWKQETEQGMSGRPDAAMPPADMPLHLPQLVRPAFDRARQAGHLHFYPTRVAVVMVGSTPFQLRYSPALANKPPAGRHHHADRTASPFADPAAPLFVCDVGPAHRLFLNKFAIVPEHSILATVAASATQTQLLDPADLAAALQCVLAYQQAAATATPAAAPDGDDEDELDESALFVFFNSGPHSGASVAHRHLQLLPVARMRDRLPPPSATSSSPWRLFADCPTASSLPLASFRAPLPPSPTPAQLHALYIDLYGRACAALAVRPDPAASEAAISYNLAMTARSLVVCPHRAATAHLPAASASAPAPALAVNGTVLAATALVRSEAEWDALVREPGLLADALGRIGVPVVA